VRRSGNAIVSIHPDAPMPDAPAPRPDRTWMLVSAAAALGAMLVAVFFILFADRLNFISGPIYYVLLIPIALGAAAVLFQAMRSRARYRGNVAHGSLEMSGPIVVFAGIVLGGVWVAKPETANLTVRVHGADDPAALITQGEIVLDLADDRRTASIGPDGQVTFAQVPMRLLSGEVRVIPRVPRYRPAGNGTHRVPPNRVIDLALERIPDSTSVAGTVLDEDGPVAGARVDFANGLAAGVTDEHGNFRITLPMEEGRTVPLVVTLDGRTVHDDNFVVSGEVGARIVIRRPAP
jgi:hypothetical protein